MPDIGSIGLPPPGGEQNKMQVDDAAVQKSDTRTVRNQVMDKLEISGERKHLLVNMGAPELKPPPSVEVNNIPREQLGNPWFNPNPIVQFRMAFQELVNVMSEMKQTEGEMYIKEMEMMPEIFKSIADDIKSSAEVEARKLDNMAARAREKAYVHLASAIFNGAMAGFQIGMAGKSALAARKFKRSNRGPSKSEIGMKQEPPASTTQKPFAQARPGSTRKAQNTDPANTTTDPTKSSWQKTNPSKNAKRAKAERAEENSIGQHRKNADKTHDDNMAREAEMQSRMYSSINMAVQSVGAVWNSAAQSALSFIDARDYSQQAQAAIDKAVFDASKDLTDNLMRQMQKHMEAASESYRSSNDQIDKLFDVLKNLITTTFRAHSFNQQVSG